MADYKIKDFYQGGYSSFKPDYGVHFTGYQTTASSLGVSTDPRSALILNEINTKIAPGQKAIELSLIDASIFESIPDEHLKEAKRLAKITGTDLTIHAPLLEPSGIDQRSGFTEMNRQAIERQMSMALERSHQISDKGNVPVTFHSSNGVPAPEIMKTKDGEKVGRFNVIDRDTGQIQPNRLEAKYYPGYSKEKLEKGEIPSVIDELDTINGAQWSNALTAMVLNKDRADQILNENLPLVQEKLARISQAKSEEEVRLIQQGMPPTQKDAYQRVGNAIEILKDTRLSASSLFNKAYKLGDEKQRDYLKETSEKFKQVLQENGGGPKAQSEAIQVLMERLQPDEENFHTPKQFDLLDNFEKEKSSETFGNVAFNAYKKYKDKAPILSIENPPAGFGLSRGEDLKDLAIKSREQFVKQATAPKDKGGLGISEREAKKAAEKLIGVTWDVGHINMLRKHGFSEEDIVKESEKVAPFLKHVHLSDNFGMEHTELPMGMGNVPFKEIMKKLGQKGFDAKKIIEAGNWWQHYKVSPMAESFQSMGSPIYSMHMQPYWNQALGFHQGYFGGYGAFLPQVNYETWGAGFSQLPQELGGQRQTGQGSRLSGRGME